MCRDDKSAFLDMLLKPSHGNGEDDRALFSKARYNTATMHEFSHNSLVYVP
jgi:hypothetical protein